MDNVTFEPKKFAVIGAGPVGGIVAAFLAKGGYEVTLCDIDMALLEPALNPGIIIEGTDTLQAKVARVTTRIEDLQNDPPDVIVVAVKAIALPAVASALRSFFDSRGESKADSKGEGPYVISWQNGIDTELVLAQQLGNRRPFRRSRSPWMPTSRKRFPVWRRSYPEKPRTPADVTVSCLISAPLSGETPDSQRTTENSIST